jgi:hypothetical protein
MSLKSKLLWIIMFRKEPVETLPFLIKTLDDPGCDIKQSKKIIPHEIFVGTTLITQYIIALNGKEMFLCLKRKPFMDDEGKDTHPNVNPLVSDILTEYEIFSNRNLRMKFKNSNTNKSIEMFNLVAQKYSEKSKS